MQYLLLAVVTLSFIVLPAQQASSRAVEHRLERYDKSPYFVVPPHAHGREVARGPEDRLADCQVESPGYALHHRRLRARGRQRDAEDVDVVRLRGTADWKRCTKTLEMGKARRAVVQVIMVMGGEVWLDDVVLTVTG